jgi:hypothetical protein
MSKKNSNKPQMFHINKSPTGQINQVKDLNGRMVERADILFLKYGENIIFAKVVYDPDHFIYQNTIPMTEDEIRLKYLGILPKNLRGPNGMCTCGAEAVYMLEGPYKEMVLCKSVAMLGKHQTSFEVKDGHMILDKKTKDEKFMTDAEIAKTMRSVEQSKDEDSDARKNDE